MQLPPSNIIASWPKPNYIDPETKGWSSVIINLSLYPLVCIALFIRIFTRLRISRGFGLDDWFVIAAFFPTTAFMVISLLSELYFKWNRHVWDVPLPSIVLGLKFIISTQILFAVANGLTKCSMLWLVYRVSSKSSGIFSKLVLSFMGLVVTQNTLFCLMIVFQCRPVSLYWTPSFDPQPTCIDEPLHLLLAGIINTSTDFITVLFPIPIVLKLQVPRRQQIVVICLFAAGLLVVAAGAVRTYYTWRVTMSYDATWNIHSVWWSSCIELYVGIMCACLPATKKFFITIIPRIRESIFFVSAMPAYPKSNPTNTNSSRHANSTSNTLDDVERDLELGRIAAVGRQDVPPPLRGPSSIAKLPRDKDESVVTNERSALPRPRQANEVESGEDTSVSSFRVSSKEIKLSNAESAPRIPENNAHGSRDELVRIRAPTPAPFPMRSCDSLRIKIQRGKVDRGREEYRR